MPKDRSAYHHGDLPRVLVAKATELLDERGVEGFSLREVARRAQVAVAAPSHHFGNVSGLLTAVALEGFRRLASSFENVLGQDLVPIDRVVGVCEAYIEHYRQYPGTVSIMFRRELLDPDHAELSEIGPRSFQLLEEAVRQAASPDTSDERVGWIAKILWATMHGLVALHLEDGEELRARVAFAARAIIEGSNDGVSRNTTEQKK